jgi:hypothetical protein
MEGLIGGNMTIVTLYPNEPDGIAVYLTPDGDIVPIDSDEIIVKVIGHQAYCCSVQEAEESIRREYYAHAATKRVAMEGLQEGLFTGFDVTPSQIPDYSGKGTMHNTDTLVAFCDFVDMLSNGGEISDGLADRVTL